MPNYFSLLWSMIKSLRYLLPFLNEVTDENGVTNDKELLKIRELKSVLHLAAWRLVYFLIVVFLIFFIVIPIHSKNNILEFELDRQIKINTKLEEIIKEHTKRIHHLEAKITNLDSDKRNNDNEKNRLRDALQQCRSSVEEYRHYVLNKDENKDNPKPPLLPKIDPTILNRLKSLHGSEEE